MKFYQLGFRYLQRKKGKTILLLIVLILVNSMILGTSMILRTTNESKQAMQEKTNSKIVAEITSKDSKITENEVNKIETLEDVSSINRIGRQEVFPNNFAPVTLNTSTDEENLKIALLAYDDLEKDSPFSEMQYRLASSDAKTWTLHKSTINVDTLLITLYETYEPVCMKQNLELKLHLSEESYPAMLTDKDRLFQILCVFMDNAIQHSKNNSLIEIEVIATEKNIAFSVVDHGQGISDEDKHYIFDRFYSGDKSHANKANFGLGLSIAKELTQMLNGTITINDTVGGGATFTVKFPLK